MVRKLCVCTALFIAALFIVTTVAHSQEPMLSASGTVLELPKPTITFTPTSTPTVNHGTAGPNSAPMLCGTNQYQATGYVEVVDNYVISGYASDADWSGAIRVHIYVDGQFQDAPLANIPRGGTIGNHGFSLNFSPFGQGTHTVAVYAIGVDGGNCATGENVLLGGAQTASHVTCGDFDELDDAYGWCTDVPDYWQNRASDSKMLSNDKISIGIDNYYGGGISQLYSSARYNATPVPNINLVDEHGGASIQLSMWANTSPTATPRVLCNQASSEWIGVYNPLQMIGYDCQWGDGTNQVVTPTPPPPGGWTIEQDNPGQFWRGEPFSGLTWWQTVQLGPEYAVIDYTVHNGTQMYATGDDRPQEMPAVWLAQGISRWYSYEDTSGVIHDVAVPTHTATPTHVMGSEGVIHGVAVPTFTPTPTRVMGSEGPRQLLRLMPNRPTSREEVQQASSGGAEPWPYIQLDQTKHWLSMCNSDQTRCVTVASFSPEIIFFSMDGGTDLLPGYATLAGWTQLDQNLQASWKVYIFPYRYDAAPNGIQVKDRIATFAPTSTPTNTPTRTPTNTPTRTPTNTPTRTPTNTPTRTPTNTPTSTSTPSCPLETSPFYPHYTDLSGINDGYQMTTTAPTPTIGLDMHNTISTIKWYSDVRANTHFNTGDYVFHVRILSCAPSNDPDHIVFTLEYTDVNGSNPVQIGSTNASIYTPGTCMLGAANYTFTIASNVGQLALVNKRLRLTASVTLSNYTLTMYLGSSTYLSTPSYYVCAGGTRAEGNATGPETTYANPLDMESSQNSKYLRAITLTLTKLDHIFSLTSFRKTLVAECLQTNRC
jgi:hypothetical protein